MQDDNFVKGDRVKVYGFYPGKPGTILKRSQIQMRDLSGIDYVVKLDDYDKPIRANSREMIRLKEDEQ